MVNLKQLAEFLAVEFRGDATKEVTKIASLDKAGSNDLSFLSNDKFKDKLKSTAAGILLIKPADIEFANTDANLLLVNNPYVAYAKVANYLDTTPKSAEFIHPSAVIGSNVKLGANVSVGANSVIEEGCLIGDNCQIGAGCFIGKNVKIGASSKLWANVSIYHNVTIGAGCLFQSGCVVGSDGFGYANEAGKWIKIPQVGAVTIGNNVEIGACTCIDRGALDDTVIEDNVIIDNLCQIAHNVYIKTGTAIAGGVILAGSLTIGRYCQIGGASVINGHMEICDNVVITGMGMVMRPITKAGIYSSGIPLQPNKVWRKTAALTMNINEIHNKVKALEVKLKHID